MSYKTRKGVYVAYYLAGVGTLFCVVTAGSLVTIKAMREADEHRLLTETKVQAEEQHVVSGPAHVDDNAFDLEVLSKPCERTFEVCQ